MSHRAIISRSRPPIFCSVRCRTRSRRFVPSHLLTVSDEGEKESGQSVLKSRLTASFSHTTPTRAQLFEICLNASGQSRLE